MINTTLLASAAAALLATAAGSALARKDARIERGRYLMDSVVACGNCHIARRCSTRDSPAAWCSISPA